MEEINKPVPSSNVEHVIKTAVKRKVTINPLHCLNLVRLLAGVRSLVRLVPHNHMLANTLETGIYSRSQSEKYPIPASVATTV